MLAPMASALEGSGGDRALAALAGQIESAMRRSMHDLIASTVAQESLTEDDADWLASLLEELRDRINGLTPNRHDFHEQLAGALDVSLARQMLLHGAADASDARALVDVVYGRLRMLCAPVQDVDVEMLRVESLSEPTPARTLATLLCRADAILSFTEALNQQAHALQRRESGAATPPVDATRLDLDA